MNILLSRGSFIKEKTLHPQVYTRYLIQCDHGAVPPGPPDRGRLLRQGGAGAGAGRRGQEAGPQAGRRAEDGRQGAGEGGDWRSRGWWGVGGGSGGGSRRWGVGGGRAGDARGDPAIRAAASKHCPLHRVIHRGRLCQYGQNWM